MKALTSALLASLLFLGTAVPAFADSALWQVSYGCDSWFAVLRMTRTTPAPKLVVVTENRKVVQKNYVSGTAPSQVIRATLGKVGTFHDVWVFSSSSPRYASPPSYGSHFSPPFTEAGLILHEGTFAFPVKNSCGVRLRSRSV